MARVPLRAYNREIESLIEKNRFEEAVAHCRHILQFFPKHIDTYRLLGKALLEGQRYSDASDILQRVLSSVPEDFIAHLGMSMIREDEGNLDEAIWHMERAFEVQPSNAAIQEELRRLYGRRDGFEPPKVRLTRGALARMYLKGGLYQQAIAEIRAARAEAPDRLDLLQLLAQAYASSGQRAEAAETCRELLHKLPYCLEANRIMADILPSSERAEDTQRYRLQLQSLDPYTAYISPVAPTSAQVPDSAVTLEKLAWTPGQTPEGLAAQPGWAASLGVNIAGLEESKQEDLPEWLAAAGSGDAPAGLEPPAGLEAAPEQGGSSQEDQPAEPAGEIPDWMRAAGWGPSSGEFKEGPLELEETQPDSSLQDELAESEIPDWLREIAPPGAESREEEIPDWLEVTQPSQSFSGEAQDEPEEDYDAGETVPSWLSGMGQAAGQTEPVQVPGAEEQPEAGETIPGWLRDLEADAPQAEDLTRPTRVGPPELVEQDEVQAEQEEGELAETIPNWLQRLDQEVVPPTEWDEDKPATPDWLKEAFSTPRDSEAESELEPTADELLSEGEEEQPEPAELPEWLKPEVVEPSQVAEEEQAGEAQSEEMDEAFAWLESLAVKQGASEALLLEPEERQDVPPEWVREEADQSEVEQPAAELVETWPAEAGEEMEPGPVAAGPLEEGERPDEPFMPGVPEIPGFAAWEPEKEDEGELESLDWLGEAGLAEEEMLESQAPAWRVEEVQSAEEALPAEEIPDWLRDLQPETEEVDQAAWMQIEEERAPAQAAEPLEWMPEDELEPSPEALAGDELVAEIPVTEAALSETPAGEPDLEVISEWSGDDAEALEELEMVEARQAASAEWLAVEEQEEEQFTAALTGQAQVESEPAQPAASPSEADLPQWIQAAVENQSIVIENEVTGVEIPNWLEGVGLPTQETDAGETAIRLDEAPSVTAEAEKDEVEPVAGLEGTEAAAEAPVQDAAAEEAGLPEMPAWLKDLEPGDDTAALSEDSLSWMLETEQPGVASAEETEQAEAETWGAEEQEITAAEELEAEGAADILQPETELAGEGELESTEPAASVPDLESEEDAFAWLESLAVKQGATEALLLSPEERQEEAPDWVRSAAEEAGEAASSEVEGAVQAFEAQASSGAPEEDLAQEAEQEAEEEQAVPAWLADLEAEEAVSPIDWEAEQRQPELVGPGEAPESAAPELAAPESGVPELELAEAEVPEPAVLEPEAPGLDAAEQGIPDLPPWLADTEGEPVEMGWEPPLPRYELNKASLAELERLPGIGFITAQAIVEHRERYGPFQQLEDLERVPGVTAGMLDALQERLYIEPLKKTTASLRTAEEAPSEIQPARQALEQGHILQALETYGPLIKQRKHLDLIIQDLQEALYRYPVDISIWQTLGDAQLRADHIQEALDAYTKAEELLR